MRILVNNLENKYIKINQDGKQRTLQEIFCDNIKISEKLRCDINKENDIYKMLDMALLCISLLASDKTFYRQNKEKLIKATNHKLTVQNN